MTSRRCQPLLQLILQGKNTIGPLSLPLSLPLLFCSKLILLHNLDLNLTSSLPSSFRSAKSSKSSLGNTKINKPIPQAYPFSFTKRCFSFFLWSYYLSLIVNYCLLIGLLINPLSLGTNEEIDIESEYNYDDNVVLDNKQSDVPLNSLLSDEQKVFTFFLYSSF